MLTTKVRERVDEVLEIAKQKFGREFPKPIVKFELRGRTAGTANFSKNELNFNYILLNANAETFIEQTVGHECAHIITYHIYGRFRNGAKVDAHGPEWRSVMIRLGLPPNRCHNYDTTNARVSKQETHTYVCGCKEHKVSTTLHNRIMKGKAYICKQCRVSLRRPSAMSMGARSIPTTSLNVQID